METGIESIFERVQTHSLGNLPFAERSTTNLHIDRRVIPAGASVGPKRLGIVATEPSVLVFADTKPLANWGHDCRYQFYSARTGEFLRTVPARLPPSLIKRPETLVAFHEPVQFLPRPVTISLRPRLSCPILWERTRFAILWSGASEKRHLNDLEFLYRTLVDRYGFDPGDIYACNFDGTLNTYDGVQTIWPGDGTPYRIKITGTGDRTGFQSAIDEVKGRIDSDDLLVVHVNGHGDVEGDPGESCFLNWPNEDPYFASDFCSDLTQLPSIGKLACMFEPCNCGGFNAPVLAASPAAATSIASAVNQYTESIGSSDGNWDCFARDWISAQAGHDPYGASLAFNPDANHDGMVEAQEAFAYANAIHNAEDDPVFTESSAAGGAIALGRQFVDWYWWCLILVRELWPYYSELPLPHYYEALRSAQPELARLAGGLREREAALRGEYEPRLAEAIAEAFRGR